MGGAQSITNEISTNISELFKSSVTAEATSSVTANTGINIMADDNCVLNISDTTINQTTNINASVIASQLASASSSQNLTSEIQSAIEQTTQNISLSINDQQQRTITNVAESLATELKTKMTAAAMTSLFDTINIGCKGSATLNVRYLSINQINNVIQDVVQDVVVKNAGVQSLAQSLAISNKQTVKNGLLAVILAVALVMVLFFGGPAILGLVVAGETSSFVFKTLSKTPETKMLLVAIIFGLAALYVSADCGGSFPVYRLKLPPQFILNLINKLPGVKIKPFVTLGIVPSFCRGSPDKDGNRPVHKTRMFIAYGIIGTLFAIAMARLVTAQTPTPPAV